MYRGWRSTKLHLALIHMALVSSAFVWMGFPTDLYGEFCAALAAGAFIFSGASALQNKADKPES